jgi:hypothetical protein
VVNSDIARNIDEATKRICRVTRVINVYYNIPNKTWSLPISRVTGKTMCPDLNLRKGKVKCGFDKNIFHRTSLYFTF